MSQAVIASNQSIKIDSYSPTYTGSINDLATSTLFTTAASEYLDIHILTMVSSRTAGGYGYSDTVNLKVTSSNGVILYNISGISGGANPAGTYSALPSIKIPPSSTVSITGYNTVNGFSSSSYNIKFVGIKFINSP